MGSDLRSGGGTASTVGAGDPQEQLEDEDNTSANTKTVTKNFGTTKGSFQFPLISEPITAFNLLLGKPVDLFIYDLPGLASTSSTSNRFRSFPDSTPGWAER